MMKTLRSPIPFLLENGCVLPQLDIAYHTFGQLNKKGNNVIWVCHALTANSDAADWWSGLIGEGKLFDPKQYFIVCANMLGSCYGASNADNINPINGKRYGADFPLISIRDMVNSHRILQNHLGIKKIQLAIGGSMGGQQVLEWSIMDPDLIEQSVIIAAGASLNAWSRGWNAAQRLALEADPTLFDDSINAGAKGLEAARAMGMLCYRTYEAYNELQVDHPEALENFRIESYLRYQGSKLSKRFTATAYWSVTRSMDTHHVGRGRGGVEAALGSISADSLVIGIQSDILFPINEQIEIANYIPNAKLEIIDSPYGHDGFLIEHEKLTSIIDKFMKKEAYHAKRPTARLEAA